MQYTEQCESRLVKRAAIGDEQAFAELVRGCQSTLYAAAMAITRNPQDAMDAVQEGVFKGWRSLGRFRAEAKFSTWMTRIVIRCAVDMTRRKKPDTQRAQGVPSQSAQREMKLDVRNAVESLDERTRLCTVLYYFEDQPVERIAEMLGIRKGTVKSRLFRARAQLKDALEDYRDDQ